MTPQKSDRMQNRDVLTLPMTAMKVGDAQFPFDPIMNKPKTLRLLVDWETLLKTPAQMIMSGIDATSQDTELPKGIIPDH